MYALPSLLSLRVALAAALLLLVAPALRAAGLGPGLANPVLGQPLDFAVQLRTDPAEALDPRCVNSEVTLGERRLSSIAVRTSVEPLGADAARVRVQTLLPVDEPVVTVSVHAGCRSSVARRYVLLVDLPESGSQVAAPAAAPMAVPEPPAAAQVAQLPPPSPLTAAQPEDPRASGTSAASDVAVPPARTLPKRAEPARRQAAAASGAQAEPSAPVQAASKSRRVASRTPAAPSRPGTARLRLEAAEPVLAAAPVTAAASSVASGAEAQAVEQALAAVAQAASAARAAASAASAASERVAQLERTVTQLRAEADGQRELAAQLRERLSRSEGHSGWVVPLVGLVLVLAALAMWLAWRLANAAREREVAWRHAAEAHAAVPTEGSASKLATAPIPFMTSEIGQPSLPTGARPRGGPAWPPPAVAEPPPATLAARATEHARTLDETEEPTPATQRTQVLPFADATGDEGARDISVEELIDLEQQAEFFVVLGQDEAAIDLLVEHLRHTGGTSPLPYLKLLEIYGRCGDRDAYERTRTRFNHRFNAYAPEWGVDLAHGRTLEDYPGVVPRLQQLWPRPLDAMAELEGLLFRKARGELFDLPAYREVLFLYSLARDLLDRESLASGNVDLLLPMADGSEFGTTAPHPYLGLESDSMPLGTDERVTVPIDLDLTRDERRTSIFDPLDEGNGERVRSP